MSRLDVSQWSGSFRVRRMNLDDAEEIYALTRQNLQYYAYCGRDNTMEDNRQDLLICPPGKTADDKYYVGFYDGDTLVAVMDLIDGYPDVQTAYIGFFMMSTVRQGQGIGSRIISELTLYLYRQGFSAVMLGYEKQNPQSSYFWQKNGFMPVREKAGEAGVIVVARKEVGKQAEQNQRA